MFFIIFVSISLSLSIDLFIIIPNNGLSKFERFNIFISKFLSTITHQRDIQGLTTVDQQNCVNIHLKSSSDKRICRTPYTSARNFAIVTQTTPPFQKFCANIICKIVRLGVQIRVTFIKLKKKSKIVIASKMYTL